MIRYIIRRLLWAVVLFIAVTIVTYIIFFVIPADPARAFAGKNPTPDQIVRARHYLGIDKPVPVQYARFLWRLTYHHSLGRSFANREPVNTLVFSAAPVTASLVIGGAVLWLLIALPLGILSAMRPRSLLDRTSMVFVLIGVSAHPVWIGLIFAFTFGYKLHWFPIQGYCAFTGAAPGEPRPADGQEQPDQAAVFQQRNIAQKQALTENRAHDCHVHRIAYVAIEPADHQVARRKNGRRRSQALYGKSHEGIQ